MAIITQKAPAKINLFLHAGERGGDGYHPLQSLAVFTDAGDTLAIDPADELMLALDGPFAGGLAAEPDNLVLRAGRALKPGGGAALRLTKNLPVASGIGGGSSDAAAALRGLARFWAITPDAARLADIAAGLGADVPVCLAAQPCFMEGRGEKLRAAESMPRIPLLLVNPGIAVATADVFAKLEHRSGVDMTLPRGRFGDTADLLRFLETTRNDLQASAIAIAPVIGEVLRAMAALPGALLTRMSGSGATCFAIFADDDGCHRAAEVLRRAMPGWWVMPTFVPEIGIIHEDVGQDIGPTDEGL